MSDRETPLTDEFERAECCDLEHALDFARGLERKLAEAREALEKIATIENRYDCGDWDEIEEAREIATEALPRIDGNIPAHAPTVGCGEGSQAP